MNSQYEDLTTLYIIVFVLLLVIMAAIYYIYQRDLTKSDVKDESPTESEEQNE